MNFLQRSDSKNAPRERQESVEEQCSVTARLRSKSSRMSPKMLATSSLSWSKNVHFFLLKGSLEMHIRLFSPPQKRSIQNHKVIMAIAEARIQGVLREVLGRLLVGLGVFWRAAFTRCTDVRLCHQKMSQRHFLILCSTNPTLK